MSRTQTFHALHRGPDLLVLPNAWDAGSARVIEAAGARAIATTSSGVAWSHGWPDGDVLPVRLLAATVADIVRAVSVPVTTDVEGGYSDDPAAVGDTLRAVADAGASGVNIEDGTAPPEQLQRKIEAAKRAAPEVFVNARVDVLLRRLVPKEAMVEEVLRRANLYAEAGCDGLFVPGLSEAEMIAAVAAGSPRPLNVMAVPGLPAPAELQRLGVRRLSAGGALASAALAQTRRLAEGFLRDGAASALFEAGLPYAELQGLFARS
jgi:2-methylisocitrate lyase-like PEP mutase family enzyme